MELYGTPENNTLERLHVLLILLLRLSYFKDYYLNSIIID